MTWQTMYPATPGSPYTTLASGIDDDDTSISLTTDPGFAAATNLACIWDDTGNFEVVRYTDLTGTTLTVERAFEGSARAWSAGAYIANLIPAYAINSLQNNVNELNSGKIAASGVTYENLNANGDVGSVSGTVCAGDDSRLSDSRTPTSHGNEAHSSTFLTGIDIHGAYASKTESDLTLYVYEDATGDADGSSKANAYTTLQDAIDAIPDVAQNVTVIVCKGSTNYLGQTTTIQKASVKSLTIQGEFYAYEACDANAVAGKIVDASADFSDFEVGDRVVCTHYSGTVESSSIDDYFYATITEVGDGYVQTSESTKIPTTGWKYLINQTVFDGTGLSAGAGVTCDNVGSDLIINGILYEKYGVPTILINICPIIRINSSIFSRCNSYTIYSTANASIDINYCAVVTTGANSRGISLSGNGATSGKVKQTIFQSAYNTSNRCIINGGLGLQCDYVSIFGYNRGFNGNSTSSGIYCRFCYISSDCAYGVYGYNVTLEDCTNNAATPVTNLTSGGSIEEWDGQALPSIDDATGGQVLALKSDKSGLEFATVSGGGAGISWNEVTGTTQTAAADNGYIANNESLVTVTLPETCAVGKVVHVAGKGSGLWKIAQNASQIIYFGDQNTTSGTAGYLAAQTQYDSIELLCITANTTFNVISVVGNITVV